MARGNYHGRGGGNRGRDHGRVRGYNEPRQGRARGYNEQRQGRGRGVRDWFHTQPRPSDQYQFTGTGAPENQPVSQNPEALPFTWASVVLGSGSTASPQPQQQQGRGSGFGTAPQQHGGGNQQQEVVDRPPPRSSDAPVLLGNINLKDKEREPMRRPADRGNNSGRPIRLHANHFPVKFVEGTIIFHYDVDVQQVDENQPVTDKYDLRKIREKLLEDKPADFPCDKTAYDGNKNIYSAVHLPEKPFTVNCSVGDDAKVCKYRLTFKKVSELQLDEVTRYVTGNLEDIPRPVLQGMDLVMKEKPKRCRISVGRCFYSKNAYRDFRCGVAAHTGFQQSLKPTSVGLALCLDSSELALTKQISVINFLTEYYGKHIKDIFKNKRTAASELLAGLKVKVNHRPNKHKFVVRKILPGETSDVKFCHQGTRKEVFLVDYFSKNYGDIIKFKHYPSLDIGKEGKPNYVPVEFCDLVGGQRFPKDRLTDKESLNWRKTLPSPEERRRTICNTVQAEDGPCRFIPGNFNIRVDHRMTSILGHILPVPDLKLGSQSRPNVNDKKCQWNLAGKSVLVDGKALQRWALIDFSFQGRSPSKELVVDKFVEQLKARYLRLGINMEEPVIKHFTYMNELSTVGKVEKLLNDVVNKAGQKNKGKLQMIVCVMALKDNGYKYLKWVSETKIGIVTQCCLSSNAYDAKDQFLANLCLKINAKLGGSNIELMERLPNFSDGDNVMFIGADVNHPTARDGDNSSSIAAVVATINWPAANKYAARVRPQEHRTEQIIEFGKMCKDLVDTYAKLNSVKPNKIVVFRDGVSESQFDMVLNQELNALVEAIYERNEYQPAITLVVAQKRHLTRLFHGGGNVSPGTVVDTKIVHPSDFDFYLCSHYGQLGTSKATHYHVLYDENGFSSADLQKLIYNMCFTFARCTKSVSLVPPVYYADLVAYRGRMFHELHTETSAASSSSSTSLEENFYGLHSDLRNIMFFV